MMGSRTAGKEPAHQIPSRDEFLKLPDDQRNQINEAVSRDGLLQPTLAID